MPAAATNKLTGYQIFVGVGLTATTLLAGAIFVQMLSQAEKLGDHGARLVTIEDTVKTAAANVVTLQQSVGEGFLKIDGSLSALRTTMDKNASDPTTMISSLGLAEPGEVFGAVIYKDALWAFPASETMATRLRNSGLERVQVNSALYGFKVMSINAPVQPQP
ncbi:hypothetical protein EN751_15645 [Mesorhizobium sp. M4A.F.Ca.ET.029.04.2.1]|nr:hypothetical protein EN751_15645 [Mesorhizobium sp. M4A.F.Ca.ET.029.04.2.1]